MSSSDKQQILRQISAITAMERGKLSAYSFEERAGDAGPYYKLQRWEHGKNHTRHVPAEEVPAVQAALAGYAQYQMLTEQYAEAVVAETRQNIAGSKKNAPASRPSRPRRGNPAADRPLSSRGSRRGGGG
jgi:hypothetical protein